jgi:hypothetical protein
MFKPNRQRKQERKPGLEWGERVGERDIAFVDSSHRGVLIWQRDRLPMDQPDNKSLQTTNGVQSLRQICANCLAGHHRDITGELLATGSWTVWKLVWQQIRVNDLDSYAIFGLFASMFGHLRDFECHYVMESHLTDNRRMRYLQTYLLPTRGRKKHRIEFISVNEQLSMKSIVNGINNSVVSNNIRHTMMLFLDLSGIQLTKQMCMDLLSMHNLVGLDVSGTGVLSSPEVLRVWKMAMTSGPWRSVRLICVGREQNSLDDSSWNAYTGLFAVDDLLYIEGPNRQTSEQNVICFPGWDHDTINQQPSSRRWRSMVFKHAFVKRRIGAHEYMGACRCRTLMLRSTGANVNWRCHCMIQEFIFSKGPTWVTMPNLPLKSSHYFVRRHVDTTRREMVEMNHIKKTVHTPKRLVDFNWKQLTVGKDS